MEYLFTYMHIWVLKWVWLSHDVFPLIDTQHVTCTLW